MSDNAIYWLWLREAATPAKARKLLETYESPEKIYDRTNYSEAPYIKNEALSKLLDKNISRAKKILDTCREKGIEILTPDLVSYPKRLLNIPDYPIVLFAKGKIPDWDTVFGVGVVGTRHLSDSGRGKTRKICKGLTASGAAIISGFAEGADTVAAETAISSGSFTVAVLGCGVDVVYPKSNALLYTKLINNGLFLSEYPPGTTPMPYYFPTRNRIIAALSRCVIVTEAPEKSGSVITGNLAIRYGIDLFAIPDKDSGTDLLINSGAVAVTEAEEITQKYSELPEKLIEEVSVVSDNPIIALLEKGDLCIDDICTTLGMSMTECNSKCFMLELEGKIRKLPGGFYSISL